MLRLTDNATSTIRHLTAGSGATEQGLRITRSHDQQSLSVEAGTVARAGDVVIEEGGARVFLDPWATRVLEDKVLDTKVDTGGHIKFQISGRDA